MLGVGFIIGMLCGIGLMVMMIIAKDSDDQDK